MLCLILGYGAKPLNLLEKILKTEGIDGVVLTDQNCERELGKILNSKVIFVYARELPTSVIEALRNCNAKVISVGLEELTNVSVDIYTKAKLYYILGGEHNLRNLVRFLATIAGIPVSYEEPQNVLLHGIYHPKLGLFDNLDEYLNLYNKRPLVGLLFWRSSWIYGDIKHIEEIVNTFEARGLGVIPVFVFPKDATIGVGNDINESIEKFLTKNGKVIVDAIVSLVSFGIEHIKKLENLGVPVFSPICSTHQSIKDWAESDGVDYMTQVYGVVIPELSGAIEPVFVAGSKNVEGFKITEPYHEHIDYLARRVKKWIELRKKPKKDIKIAIVLINPPCKGLEASIAVGAGLDVPESVVRLLYKLEEEGYTVDGIPKSGKDLAKLILEKKAISEFRWTSVSDIVKCGGAVDFVSLDEYLEWFNEFPEDLKNKIIKDWGRPEDVLAGGADSALVGMVYEGKFVIPGIKFGNVFITPQPKFGCAGARCDGKVCRVLHDPTIVPPHQWWAVYRWITRKFKADVVIHFGTHGSLEFRPGKGVGLSPSCVPEVSLDDIPHLYIYVVSNPMEGVIAKRRGYATLVDHLYPPMAMAEVLDELDSLLNQYARARSLGERKRERVLYEEILKKAKEYKIKIKNPENEDETIEEIHRYVELMRGTQVNLGLHIFGNPPKDAKKLAEYVVTAMNYDSPDSPSIKRVVAESIGINYNKIRREPMGVTNGYANRELLERIHKLSVNILQKLLNEENYDVVSEEIKKAGFKIVDARRLVEVFKKALEVARRVLECEKEYDGFLKGLRGKYVEPGPSGAITRGKFEILPTGRNFYAVDLRALPTKSAWCVGVETAKKLLEEFRRKYGKYPECVGQVLWSIDAYKADGEQIAQILYLLGVKPVWKGDRVVGIEVIPLEELKRPRIDVLIRISGIVRDTLPNYIYLIDEAIEKVVALNEPAEMNYVRKHYLEHIRKLVEIGKRFEDAQKLARFRIFGAPPGAYGAGVNLAVESSGWLTDEDLAKVWVRWSGYAYSREDFGIEAYDSLVLNLKEVDVINRNHISDEHDLTNCCCYFAYHGGFKKAIDALTDREVDIVQVDTRDLDDIKIVDVKVEIERIVRTKLLNDLWIEEMKRHGYRGASEFSKKILHLYGWEATTNLVEDWIFNEIAEKYILNEKMKKWFEENNVYALEEITRRLIEAYERGLWRTDEDLIERIREVYSEIEGILEEYIGGGDLQGGTIEIYTAKDDEHWMENMRRVDELWQKIKE